GSAEHREPALTTEPGQPLVALRFDDGVLWALDQRELPWRESELELRTAEEVAAAIRCLAIRGAPLIGLAAAYGVALELARDPSPSTLERACSLLEGTRPTAANLRRAVQRVRSVVGAAGSAAPDRIALAEAEAIRLEEEQASE